MTLFDPPGQRVRRSSHPVPRGKAKPVWVKYKPKKPQRCDECVAVAYETAMTGEPFPGISNARQSRRQDGVTRLFCNAHAHEQKREDHEVHGVEYRA